MIIHPRLFDLTSTSLFDPDSGVRLRESLIGLTNVLVSPHDTRALRVPRCLPGRSSTETLQGRDACPCQGLSQGLAATKSPGRITAQWMRTASTCPVSASTQSTRAITGPGGQSRSWHESLLPSRKSHTFAASLLKRKRFFQKAQRLLQMLCNPLLISLSRRSPIPEQGGAGPKQARRGNWQMKSHLR